MKIFNLNEKELNGRIIFDRIKKNELTQAEAAQLLKLNKRQVKRKLKRYLADGADGLAHQGRGKRSNRAIGSQMTANIFNLIQEKYSSFKEKAGPTFLSDQLAKNHDIKIDHETLRRMMTEKGILSV